MSTDLTYPSTPLADQMEFARAVTSGGRAASILPEAYRDNPANVLIAIGLGQSMGLSPAESLYRIAVIKGKPSASAELIAANVRKAGHRLRVQVQEDPPRAVAEITRADDPDSPIAITRDMAWAQRMGLANEPNYKKQPATMLSYRAITAAARLACPEALYGVAYTPDEISEAPDARPTQRVTVADIVPAAPVEDVHDAEVEPPTEEGITPGQLKKMGAQMREAGLTGRDEALAYVASVIGRDVATRSDLTKVEAGKVIDALEQEPAPAADVTDWPEVQQPGADQ